MENKIDWKRKLTSRKWWNALINCIVQIMYMASFSETAVERVVAMLAATAGFIAATIAEGLVDAAHAGTEEDEGNDQK